MFFGYSRSCLFPYGFWNQVDKFNPLPSIFFSEILLWIALNLQINLARIDILNFGSFNPMNTAYLHLSRFLIFTVFSIQILYIFVRSYITKYLIFLIAILSCTLVSSSYCLLLLVKCIECSFNKVAFHILVQ